MMKVLAAISGAALLAGAITFMPGVAPGVEASTPAPAVKGDRLDIRSSETPCSQRSWPYYEVSCLHDAKQNAGRARPVRMVSPDRLPR